MRRKKRLHAELKRRLSLEVLEDRTLLSTFTVTSLADGPGVITPDPQAANTYFDTTLRGALEQSDLSNGPNFRDCSIVTGGFYAARCS